MGGMVTLNELKYALVPAAVSFGLSFITGILFRVGLVTAFLRAFLFALLFGALGFGVRLLFKQFLPELLPDVGAAKVETEETEKGDGSEEAFSEEDPVVDIVMEGDEDEHASLYRGNGGEGEAETLEAADTQAPSREGASEESTDFSSLEEVGAEDEAIDELEEVDEEEEQEAASSQERQEAAGMQALPDLDSFSDAFSSVADSQIGESGASPMSSGQEVDLMGSRHDASEVAKAIRTLMKKDQEG